VARTEGDTWDLASSVGATATGVAASRALASKQPNPLISDPFADALVKAVGLDYCNRMADGELEFTDDPLFNRERICEQIAVRTRFFDDFFTSAASAGNRQAVNRRSSTSRSRCWKAWAPQPPPIIAPLASISAMTGRQHCGTVDLMQPGQPHGSRRDC
jgi:hypothetical protein